MKKVLVGTAFAALALAPAVSFADCDFHNKASMALSKPADKSEVAQASSVAKSSAAVLAKSDARQVKQAVDKKSATKKDGATVVAKNN